MVRRIGGIAKKANQALSNTGQSVAGAGRAAGKVIGEGARKTEGAAYSGVKKLLTSPKHGPIIDAKPSKATGETERLSNLYTGKRLNPTWVGALGGGYMVGKSAYSEARQNIFGDLDLATQNYVGSGSADIMNYDGVSNERVGAPSNLNATGDIVFGLHNQRRG